VSSLADVCSGGEEETDDGDADDGHHDSAVDSCSDESATADVVETEHGDEDVVAGSDGGDASTVGVSGTEDWAPCKSSRDLASDSVGVSGTR